MDADAKTRLSQSRPDPFVGRTFDGYRIEEAIGRGGMGTVYRAQQLSLGRSVAIKVLPPDLAGKEQFLERFLREADALSRLGHPNVVAVYDRGEVDGQPYLVMEYVEGTSLRELMREGPLPAAEAYRIVSSVLAALEHAHERGIVHRDIKPENVLLSKGRVVKVADFGLSRLLGPVDVTRLTRTQLVLGTYEYMAPEQRERAREADPRSDIYATGVVLYEMLTGELPIGRFALPSRRRPEDCDGRTDRLVEQALEKNPARRFQKAEEMADAVSVLLEHPEPVEPPAPPPSRPSAASYRPARFEYHIDNVATIDHVLGTIAYVFGFVALFGLFGSRTPAFSVPFFFFFIGGWYLRATAEGLRKYKTSARTAQAVIAILAAFTGLLVPFTIYSFWALYSHRGRTYYDARGRGLAEPAAARHVQRVLEEPAAPPPPASVAQPTPPAPRPSQIPVQSIVTSEVVDEPRPRRRSWFVRWGWATFLFFLLVGGFGVVVGHDGVTDLFASDDAFYAAVAGSAGLAAVLLAIGFFHALFSSRATGAVSAFVGLVLLGIAGTSVTYLGTTRAAHPSLLNHADTRSVRLGSYVTAPAERFEEMLLAHPPVAGWLRRVTALESLPETTLRRRGRALWLEMERLGDVRANHALARAVQVAVTHALPGRFEPGPLRLALPEGFQERLDENPPPRLDARALEAR